MSSWWAGPRSFTITSLVVSRVASTWQTLKKLLLNQTKPTGCETGFREAGSGCLGHQRSQHSDGGVRGRDGRVTGTQRGGSPNQRGGHLFFWVACPSQDSVTMERMKMGSRESPDICCPGARAQPGWRTAWGIAWGMKSGLHVTEMERLGK